MNNQLKLFLYINNLLKSANIEYWLDYGTLLGAIRENNFLRHDLNDIDIGLNIKDYWKVRNLLSADRNLKYKNIWRTEIVVYLTDDVHLDLFFYEEKNNIISTCAYLGNKKQNGINIESCMKHNINDIYPLKNINFLNVNVNIPNNPENYLKDNYGEDWKTPDNNWCHTKIKSFDDNHRTIGILIPTFLRDDKMMVSIKTILKYCDTGISSKKWIRLYIGDQGYENWSYEKKFFYEQLKADGHQIYKLPFNCGLSYARNFLVKQSNEPYLMIIDDDFKFIEKTNLTYFLSILNHRKENGLVGGNIENRASYHANLVFEKLNNNLYLHRIKCLNEEQILNPYYSCLTKDSKIRYYYTDIVLNFFIAKREVLENLLFDENLKLCEHSDYFIRLKKQNIWRICYYPETTCEHIKTKNSEIYDNFRQNNNYLQMFLDKWELNNIKNIKFIEELPISKIEPKKILQINKKIKVVQIARIPCANSGYELSQLINAYSDKYSSTYILGNEYSSNNNQIPYRAFPYEYYWKKEPDKCIEIIQNADIIHIHHDIWEEIIPYLKNKKIVSTVYNLTNSLQYNKNNHNIEYLKKLQNLGLVTIADQPLQKKMFSDISNIYVPLIKMLFSYPIIKNKKLTIGYSPTNKLSSGIGSKRYNEVLNIISNLKKNYDFEFDLIEGIPYEENLLRKSKCHILIDDVDDKYEKAHNTTLESALFEAIPLTNYSGKWFPAIKTDIITLKQTLIKLIETPIEIEKHKIKLREWKEKIYTPYNLLNIYQDLYDKMLNNKICTNINDINKYEFQILNEEFKKNNIKYCLINLTCLDTVKYGKLKTDLNNIYLSVNDLAKATIVVNNLNLKTKINLFSNYPKQTKKLGFYEIACNVPFPVITYLENMFGKDWKNFK